jgi:hypothetical protein
MKLEQSKPITVQALLTPHLSMVGCLMPKRA